MNADGSDVTPLTDSPLTESEPAWSPDGSKLAFVRGYDPTDVLTVNLSSCADPKIYVMNADGSDAQELLPGWNGTDPAWSPNGRQIALVPALRGHTPFTLKTW